MEDKLPPTIRTKLSYKVRGAIFEVHRELGPGLFEECYHQALLHELRIRGLKTQSKCKLPVLYKGHEIKDAYEADIIVEDKIIIEIKSVEELSPKHFKQLMNYLSLKDLHVGFLVNFNTVSMDKENLHKLYNSHSTNQDDI